MKRRRDSVHSQPAAKRTDVNSSTDLRSKIGAKLQTLLQSKRDEIYRRRHAFIFGEPEQYPAIIIDPTIVVKTEDPDEEECTESTEVLNSQNFLLSAKSRITELLNKSQGGTHKFKNHEKENSNECSSVSSLNSASTSSNSTSAQARKLIQSLSSNINRKKKLSNHKTYQSSSSGVLTNQIPLENMVVVVEDIMKNRTKYSQFLSSKSVIETLSESHETSECNNLSVDRQKKKTPAKVPVSSIACDTNISTLNVSTISQSCHNSNSINNNLNGKSSESKSSGDCKNSPISSDKSERPTVIDLGDILITSKEAIIPPVACHSNHTAGNSKLVRNLEFVVDPDLDELKLAEDSELVDEPDVVDETSVHKNVNASNSVSSGNETLSDENPDSDVVLLCVKQPTHEVITLEDNDESEVVEEVLKCDQCGKTFRLKSLLNFHVRMHGNELFSSSQSSSVR